MYKAETFLILKYGTIMEAHKAGLQEGWDIFSAEEYNLLMEWESAMHEYAGLGINDPR